MRIVTIEEAQAKLAELIDKITLGEEVIITRDQQLMAQLVQRKGLPTDKKRCLRSVCRAGSATALCRQHARRNYRTRGIRSLVIQKVA